MVAISARPRASECPQPAFEGGPIISEAQPYESIRPYLFTDSILERVVAEAQALRERHERGEIIIRMIVEGFFWFPRTIFGIENHLFAFYDEPDLMRRMNADLAEFNVRAVEALFQVLTPDMVGFAEDMSYNNGPMLSRDQFNTFVAPYYHQVVPEISRRGAKILVDSDGDITTMIPWLQDAGIEGVCPLERQAGVDLAGIRRNHPDFLLLGGYDKMVMFRDEQAMRTEFERLLPIMKSGGFIPSVDHQTPPEVTLDQYYTYLRLFREFAGKAAE